ncbi:MAG: ATP-binding cassette domain-containing protein [Thermoplasmatota archaeon]
MKILKMRGVRKKLGKRTVLWGIDLDVRKGEIMALVGPSGSGKSTLLRCLNRMTEADSGEIMYNGEDVRDMIPRDLRREVALVFQESVMLPGTVLDNVSYGQKLKGSEDRSLIERSLEDSGLSVDFLDREASKLSGGEKKRVSLARALAIEPKILLLDEPTAGVDPKMVSRVERAIVNFSRERDLTVLWVTHDVEQARRVSDRIANLKDGRVMQVSESSKFRWEGAY